MVQVIFDSLGRPSVTMRGARATMQPYENQMSNEDEQSLWKDIGSAGWSGIGAIGSILDVPGGIARNTIDAMTGGDSNPFEPLMNPMATTGRIMGRELLGKFGAPPNVEGMPWESPEALADLPWDIAGLATEILTDPLTYFTFGGAAVSKMGQALKATGATDDFVKAVGKRLNAGVPKDQWRRVGQREAFVAGKLDDLLADPKLAAKYGKSIDDFALANNMTVNDLKAMRPGSLVGFKIPFGGVIPLAGELSTQHIARGVDTAWDLARNNPASLALTGLMKHSTQGVASTRAAQEFAMDTTKVQTKAVALGREKLVGAARGLHESGWFDVDRVVDRLKITRAEAEKEVIELGERIGRYIETGTPLNSGATYGNTAKQWYGAGLDQAEMTNIETLFGKLTPHMDAELKSAQQMGVRMDMLSDMQQGILEQYLPRDWQELVGWRRPLQAKQDAVARVARGFMKERDKATTGFAGGVYALDHISTDFKWSGAMKRTDDLPGYMKRGTMTESEVITNAHKELMEDKWQELIFGPDRTKWPGYDAQLWPTLVDKKTGLPSVKLGDKYRANKTNQIATRITTIDPRHAEQQLPMFSYDPFEAVLRYTEGIEQSKAALSNAYDFALEHVTTTPGVGRKLSSIFGGSGGLKQVDAKGAAWEFTRRFTATPQGQADFNRIAAKYLAKRPKATPEAVNRFVMSRLYVDEDVAGAITKVVDGFSYPEAMHPVLEAWDAFTRMWKGSVTVVWPGFHTRNWVSGTIRNWSSGYWSVADYTNANNLLKHNTMRNAAAEYPRVAAEVATANRIPLNAVTDQMVSDAIQEKLFSWQVLEHHSGMAGDVVARGGQRADIPGVTKAKPMRTPGTTAAGNLLPWVPGSAGQRVGSQVSYAVEGVNRITPFLNAIKKGYTDEQAKYIVDALQVNYGNLTKVDREFFRRVFPFWNFQKNVIPWTVGEILTKPGGRLAWMPKQVARLRSEDPIMPEYVQESAAIRVPGAEEGGQRFVSTLGLMEEPGYALAAPLARLPFNPMQAGGQFFREGMGHLHPALRMVPELAFGRSTFFGGGEPGGRELRTLTPGVGQIAENIQQMLGAEDRRAVPLGIPGSGEFGRAVEYGLQATPFAGRLISEGSRFTNPRLPWSLRLSALGGLSRAYEITPRQMATLQKESLDREMAELGGSRFTTVNLNEEAIARLPSGQRQKAEQLKVLRSILNRRMKALD